MGVKGPLKVSDYIFDNFYEIADKIYPDVEVNTVCKFVTIKNIEIM